MTLSDLNPEVTAFFEVEHLGPDWSLCQIRDQVFDLTSNRPIWPISDINASHIYLVLSFLYVGLAKKILFVQCARYQFLSTQVRL